MILNNFHFTTLFFFIRNLFFILVCFFIIYSFLTKFSFFHFLKNEKMDNLIIFTGRNYRTVRIIKHCVTIDVIDIYAPEWYKYYFFILKPKISILLLIFFPIFFLSFYFDFFSIPIMIKYIIAFYILLDLVLYFIIDYWYINSNMAIYLHSQFHTTFLLYAGEDGTPGNGPKGYIMDNYFNRNPLNNPEGRRAFGRRLYNVNKGLMICATCLYLLWPINEFYKDRYPNDRTPVNRALDVILGKPEDAPKSVPVQNAKFND